MKTIYLDYAAATPLDKMVREVMEPYLGHQFYNPSATYLAGRATREAVERARERTANVLGVRPGEVYFTAGGTEANNLAIHGVMAAHPKARMLVAAIEHKSVLEPAATHGADCVPVGSDGAVDQRWLSDHITDDVVLVSIGYVNNEIGVVQPLADVAKALELVRKDRTERGVALPLYLHTDACQAANYLIINPHTLGVDIMTLNGGKIYGPKQSGMLYVRTGVVMTAHLQGGGQEHGLRSGTENVAGIIGFTTALEHTTQLRAEETRRITGLRADFVRQLEQGLPNAIINGSMKHRVANNVHITLPGIDNERVMMELDERGIMCAVGSACNASDDEPSHVLKAIGLSDEDARSSLRFTLGRQTTTEDIAHVAKVLKEVCGG